LEKDFRGKPFGNNQATALLHSNLKWRANRLYNYPAGTVIAFVEPDSSFRRELTDNLTPELRDSLYNVLLKHEQVHFNIAEYYARRANEKIASEWFLSESEVESIAKSIYTEYVKKEIEYDSVTNNSINIALQEKWAEAYKNKLNIK
jgi:hypothetical protein